jgi:hypothetical protein
MNATDAMDDMDDMNATEAMDDMDDVGDMGGNDDDGTNDDATCTTIGTYITLPITYLYSISPLTTIFAFLVCFHFTNHISY